MEIIGMLEGRRITAVSAEPRRDARRHEGPLAADDERDQCGQWDSSPASHQGVPTPRRLGPGT
eukprot:10716269-Heterocapsa_arctica.AAC.1